MTVRGPQPFAAAARVGLVALVAVFLCGCAGLPFLSPKSNDVAPTQTSVPMADRAEYRLDVQAPDELRPLLVNYLDLARFQSAPATEGITRTELERLILAAPAQARGLLETEGYFNAEVTVDKLPAVDTAAGTILLVQLRVQPGPPVTVEAFTFDAQGNLQAAAQAGDPVAVQELAELRRLWPLQPGDVFRQSTWSAAKNSAIARLRADGYAAADWSSTRAAVDAPSNQVRLEVVADSGPLYRMGEVRIEGLQRYDADSVRKLATFGPGTPYSEKLLLDFQERIQKVGLFEGASVEIDAELNTAAAAPVIVRVKEFALQQATIGVGYSANTGARLSVEHTQRRLFGSRWIAKNKFELGPLKQAWGGDLTSYPLDGQYRNLIAGAATRLKAADEVLNSWSARIGRTQDTPRIERLYFAEATQARIDGNTLTSNARAISGNYHWVFRDVDNVLLPSRGVTTSAQAAVGYAIGQITRLGDTVDDRGPFARAYGRLTWYRPFGQGWHATMRLEGGQVFTNHPTAIPDTLLFRAGGDDSVRGYGYRTLGPTVDGVVLSGRTLLTASAEIARPISPKYPAYWWTLFVDAGNAANTWSALRPVLGYGAGLQWRSPVGPLRVDLAYGQAVRAVRLHLSVGIAF